MEGGLDWNRHHSAFSRSEEGGGPRKHSKTELIRYMRLSLQGKFLIWWLRGASKQVHGAVRAHSQRERGESLGKEQLVPPTKLH